MAPLCFLVIAEGRHGMFFANGEDRAKLEDEYKQTVGSVYTAAACGAVDDVFAPEETRNKVSQYLDMLMNKRETTVPRKHSVK